MKDAAAGDALTPVEIAAPTLSDALEKWLERETSARADISTDGQTADWWNDFDNCGQLEIAARVRRGFRLAQIRAASERDFQAGLKSRDVALTSAYELIDTYKLFVAFPSLPSMDRAAALGFVRIRELKPHFGIEGLRALIEGKEVDTLTYDAAVGMSKRDIVAWRKSRMLAQLELGVAQSGVEVPEVKPAPVKPRALEAATDELLGAVSRAWHEVNRAKRVVEQLLPPGTDEWQPARTELAHAAHLMIRGIADETGALDDLLVKRFGVTVTRPREGEYRTLAASLLVAINNATETQADADTNARAKQRHARLKWRGAPPKTLDAVIANARNGDRE